MEDFFDAEDAHPVTREEIPYSYDDYAHRSRSGVLRKGSGQGAKPGQAVPGVRKDHGASYSPAIKKSGTKASGFIQIVQEMSPLIHLAHQQIEGEFTLDEYQANLTMLIKSQQLLLGDVCDRIGLNAEDLGDRFLVGNLSMRISKVYHSLRDLPNTVVNDSVNLALSELDRWIAEKGMSIREMINENVSSDILVNVKLGLFSPTIRLYSVFEKWGIGKWREKHAIWMMDLAVDFSRDVSFNWDKKANFRDKQSLFQGVLENCADLVIDVYEQAIREYVRNAALASYGFEDGGLTGLIAAIDSMSMGYDQHPTINRSWLLSKMVAKKESMLLRYMPMSMGNAESMGAEKLLISKIDEILAEVWMNSCKATIDHLQNMPDDERDEFLESEAGSKPMPLETFDAELEKSRPDKIELISFNDINLQEVAQVSRKLLAEMWGISDAFCKISKNSA